MLNVYGVEARTTLPLDTKPYYLNVSSIIIVQSRMSRGFRYVSPKAPRYSLELTKIMVVPKLAVDIINT